jgi:hypothetical protein
VVLVAGGGGQVGEKGEGVKPHLSRVLRGAEVVGGGLSATKGGWWRYEMTEAVLR